MTEHDGLVKQVDAIIFDPSPARFLAQKHDARRTAKHSASSRQRAPPDFTSVQPAKLDIQYNILDSLFIMAGTVVAVDGVA